MLFFLMPSSLEKLFRKLEWKDFAVRQEAPPKAGQIVVAARTDTKHSLTFGPEVIPGTKKVRLADTVVSRIFLEPAGTFQKSWITSVMQQTDRDELLAHEQGHYDIHALLTRDFFLRVMKLKSKEYANSAALAADVTAAQRATVDKSGTVQARYDTVTSTGGNKAEQAKWKRIIASAFDTPATPLELMENGNPVKIELLTAFGNNGITF
jgi:hypothetical protein